MKQIRYGVFETNSSSTHSLVICTQSEYNKWDSDYVLNLNCEDLSKFVKVEEALEYIKRKYNESLGEKNVEDFLKSYEFYTPDSYDDYELEWYEEHFVTPSGDKMVVFGRYGFDR